MGNEAISKTPEEQNARDMRLIQKFEIHRDFSRVFLDGFVLINSQGKIIKFNQMFCTTVGMRAIDVRKVASVDETLVTDIQNSAKSAIDMILEATTPLRIDEVQAKRKASNEFMQLIIGSYPFLDDDGSLLGACVLLRDVTAETNLQGKYTEKALQSVTDPLTGLYTRRYFEDFIDKEMDRYKSVGEEPALGVLMFDLDKFKTVNDTFGHQAGDFVLVETAKILRANSRKTDILGRYGGEELLALLLSTTQKGSCIAAEKFRHAIETHEYVFEGKRIPVTTSVGVSIFLEKHETRENVLARADKCLYAAKHNGRNVVFADFGEGEFKVPGTPPAGSTES